MSNPQSANRLTAIRLIAMDVDGVLTDGKITWAHSADETLSESKSFDVKDGLGISLALAVGLEVAWITGRHSPLLTRRAEELRIPHLCQGARDKRLVLAELAKGLILEPEQVLYVGDDLNDLPAFDAAGFKVAVADAVPEVRAAADWITEAPGGKGAIREVIDAVLSAKGEKEMAIRSFLQRLQTEQSRSPETSGASGQ